MTREHDNAQENTKAIDEAIANVSSHCDLLPGLDIPSTLLRQYKINEIDVGLRGLWRLCEKSPSQEIREIAVLAAALHQKLTGYPPHEEIEDE